MCRPTKLLAVFDNNLIDRFQNFVSEAIVCAQNRSPLPPLSLFGQPNRRRETRQVTSRSGGLISSTIDISPLAEFQLQRRSLDRSDSHDWRTKIAVVGQTPARQPWRASLPPSSTAVARSIRIAKFRDRRTQTSEPAYFQSAKQF
jgi:hypothetical protein